MITGKIKRTATFLSQTITAISPCGHFAMSPFARTSTIHHLLIRTGTNCHLLTGTSTNYHLFRAQVLTAIAKFRVFVDGGGYLQATRTVYLLDVKLHRSLLA